MKGQPFFIKILSMIGMLIPGDYLKTAFYLNCIAKPRKMIRQALNSFYRMDHVYDVLQEFRDNYNGKFSVLEFGVADGYSFTKKIYATQYLKMQNFTKVYGFDSFEGMPEPEGKSDSDLIANDGWVPGQFNASFENLQDYCSKKFANFQLLKGFFEETLTEHTLKKFEQHLPILIWIDCDYYSSTKTIFDRLIPFIPNGCVIYFDDYEFNFGSRFTGESRIIYEINHGLFGEGIELVLDSELSMNSKRVYRFINYNSKCAYQKKGLANNANDLRRRTNDSPFP